MSSILDASRSLIADRAPISRTVVIEAATAIALIIVALACIAVGAPPAPQGEEAAFFLVGP